jgi:circadian clock protein KaiC
MILRLMDFMKTRGTTALLTNLTSSTGALEGTDVGISSIADTWLLLRDIELGGERNHALYILKSRGMKHSNQIREFLLTDDGVRLVDVYAGTDGVLTGSMRVAQEAAQKAKNRERGEDLERKRRELTRKRNSLEAELASMKAELEAQDDALAYLTNQGRSQESQVTQDRADMAQSRRSWDDEAR